MTIYLAVKGCRNVFILKEQLCKLLLLLTQLLLHQLLQLGMVFIIVIIIFIIIIIIIIIIIYIEEDLANLLIQKLLRKPRKYSN